VIVLFGQHAAQRRRARAHHVHRVRGRRQRFERGLDGVRQAAPHPQLGLVALQLAGVRQLAVHQQVSHFLEFRAARDVQDVVAAVMQIVAGAADGAQGRVAGGDAGQGHGFFRFEGDGGVGLVRFAHGG
jgi:hypothetical protein